MKLHKDTSILVGKHGILHFKKGCYVYVGSALNGLEQRIQRHLSTNKKIHWHIDYLLPFTEIVEILYKENTRRGECAIARMFKKNFTNIPVLDAVIAPVEVTYSMDLLKNYRR